MDSGSVRSGKPQRRMLKIIAKYNTTLKKENKQNFSCVIFCHYIVDLYVFNFNKTFIYLILSIQLLNYLYNLKLEKDRRFQICYSLI